MICPRCKIEYIDGVTRCAECDVDLVESLAEPGGDALGLASDADLRSVWSGEDQELCAGICARLKEAGVPFRTSERVKEFLTNLGQHFEIGVAPEDFDRAKGIVGRDFPDSTDEADDLSGLELPAEDDGAEHVVTDEGWDPENWHPEDADREIWNGGTQEQAVMIEASLRENNIHARIDDLDDGPRKIFVTREDELRAKEIVREIDEAAPPK
jgi:hypothetical protein